MNTLFVVDKGEGKGAGHGRGGVLGSNMLADESRGKGTRFSVIYYAAAVVDCVFHILRALY